MTEYRKQRCIAIAKTLFYKKTGKNFHVSFILDKNKLLVTGVNSYADLHLSHRFGIYKPQKKLSEDQKSRYVAGRHSEIVAINTYINIYGDSDCSGLTLFNVRLDNEGLTRIAKPCNNCLPIIESCGFKKIIWT